MSYEKCISVCKMFSIVLLVVCFTIISLAQDNTKWIARGSNPQDYKMGGDPTIDHGSGDAAYIFSIVDSINGFGTWMTVMPVGEYLGQRLMLSAHIKTENVKDWVGLWMRVDGEDHELLAFDNMQDRSIKRSTDWAEYSVVLDIHEKGVEIFYGLLLAGTGKVWFDGLSFELVGTDVPVTGYMGFEAAYKFGEYQKAVELLEKFMGTDHEYTKIWHYIALQKANRPEKAQEFLTDFSKEQIKDEWIEKIVGYFTESLTDDEFINAANDTSATREKEKKCEAYFCMGINHLFQDNQDKAKDCFEKCLEHEVKGFSFPQLAQIELDRLNKK